MFVTLTEDKQNVRAITNLMRKQENGFLEAFVQFSFLEYSLFFVNVVVYFGTPEG